MHPFHSARRAAYSGRRTLTTIAVASAVLSQVSAGQTVTSVVISLDSLTARKHRLPPAAALIRLSAPELKLAPSAYLGRVAALAMDRLAIAVLDTQSSDVAIVPREVGRTASLFGGVGQGLNELDEPSQLVAASGSYYVFDPNNERIAVLLRNGTRSRHIRVERSALGVVASRDIAYYVTAQTGTARIVALKPCCRARQTTDNDPTVTLVGRGRASGLALTADGALGILRAQNKVEVARGTPRLSRVFEIRKTTTDSSGHATTNALFVDGIATPPAGPYMLLLASGYLVCYDSDRHAVTHWWDLTTGRSRGDIPTAISAEGRIVAVFFSRSAQIELLPLQCEDTHVRVGS